MAGEWIPIDCNLATKPEVLELVEITGLPIEVVVFRILSLWFWASMNTATGVVRATSRTLAAIAGGDDAFWSAVEAVGWIRMAGDGTVEIVGWEKRFSRAAKARAENARRASEYRAQDAHGGVRNSRTKSARHRAPKSAPQDRTGEEKTGENRTGEDRHTPYGRVSGGSDTHEEALEIHGMWEEFRQAWNRTPNTTPYNALGCPPEALGVVTDPGFHSAFQEALARLGASTWFERPAAITWFIRNWSRVLAGEFDSRLPPSGAKPKPKFFQLEEEKT
jgi:hypothetical protein